MSSNCVLFYRHDDVSAILFCTHTHTLNGHLFKNVISFRFIILTTTLRYQVITKVIYYVTIVYIKKVICFFFYFN